MEKVVLVLGKGKEGVSGTDGGGGEMFYVLDGEVEADKEGIVLWGTKGCI